MCIYPSHDEILNYYQTKQKGGGGKGGQKRKSRSEESCSKGKKARGKYRGKFNPVISKPRE